MKVKNVVVIIVLVLFLDQLLKFYIKTNFHLGQVQPILGNVLKLHFAENEGMAWGWSFGGQWGKIILTLFRLIAVVVGVFIIKDFIKKKYHSGFIVCCALVFAGALGNLIDSLFYGLLFSASDPFSFQVAEFFPLKGGYAGLFHGKVVDMIEIVLIKDIHIPDWVPFMGGARFDFFPAVFNIADSAISVGIVTMFIFQNKFFKKDKPNNTTIETSSSVDDHVQVS